MKVLNLSSFDVVGGAARSAYRIHKGLQCIGVDSSMLVQFKSGHSKEVYVAENRIKTRSRSFINSLPVRLHSNCTQMFSPQWFPDAITSKVATLKPDLINLNWVCNGFMQIETLAKFSQPIVWTLQDMWAFTGGCHYSQGCERYQGLCGSCPQLKSDQESDLSRSVWQRKAQAWNNINLTVVAPSQWMAKCAHDSSLFKDVRVEVIPFGLDITIFKPFNPQSARELLDLPQEKKLVLFGALDATGDTRKGFHLLQTALKRLSQLGLNGNLELVIFGSSKPEKPHDLSFPVHYLGRLNDELSLRTTYAAADVMVAPSLEEAFGQTASESLACGTPVVVFKETGLADIVDHKKNGYVANYGDPEDLANGIKWVVEDIERHHHLRSAARTKAEREYASKVQATRYFSLFQNLLNQPQSSASYF